MHPSIDSIPLPHTPIGWFPPRERRGEGGEVEEGMGVERREWAMK